MLSLSINLSKCREPPYTSPCILPHVQWVNGCFQCHIFTTEGQWYGIAYLARVCGWSIPLLSFFCSTAGTEKVCISNRPIIDENS